MATLTGALRRVYGMELVPVKVKWWAVLLEDLHRLGAGMSWSEQVAIVDHGFIGL